MTFDQEKALYEFLENITEPFTLEEVTSFIRTIEVRRSGRLDLEIAAFIDSQNLAFRPDSRRWISRRGCFESAPFVIRPTRLELLNGILIPGHRCVPFANPQLHPHRYVFYWKGGEIPATTTEGPPEDLYPYYCIFGEEYTPQYIAQDNPENERAFNSDPYEDPPEVSIKTVDMRNVYRETSFVPGDLFVVRTRNWKDGVFELEKAGKDEWPAAELDKWLKAAEGGFEDSFSLLGPGAATEEQIAYAYWYGGERMRNVPAYALEDFLYEKTDRIETVSYGIETRFWFAGKEIPDRKDIDGMQALPDRTMLEEMLYRRKIPVSEYVIQAYVRDALFRGEDDIDRIVDRIVPPSLRLDEQELDFLAGYLYETMDETKGDYSVFADQDRGPIRQRVGELHTAVIDLGIRLRKGDINPAWLPKHTFIVLSQIQYHAAGILEDLDADEEMTEGELEAMDNSVDSMIETYEEIKEMIDDALDRFRRNNLSVVKDSDSGPEGWKTMQISITGTEVWRRILIPRTFRLEDIHHLIQAAFNWKGSFSYRFSTEKPAGEGKGLDERMKLERLCDRGPAELVYEYGARWTVKVIILAGDTAGRTVCCIAGEGSAPPEYIEGPLRFRKILASMENGNDTEKRIALHELGPDFSPGSFNIENCNRDLSAARSVKKAGLGPMKMDF
ncbi:MAG: plasmid pRiA4b ORF-3 family protein [Treponema sp.]|jgi:hypothetical protein|nr:plasmid pRiA4b ORF-3 family protein [Treponema sp.]